MVLVASIGLGLVAATACKNQKPAQMAQLTCQILMVNEPYIKLAAEQIGEPIDVYAAKVCEALPTVEPLLRVMRQKIPEQP